MGLLIYKIKASHQWLFIKPVNTLLGIFHKYRQMYRSDHGNKYKLDFKLHLLKTAIYLSLKNKKNKK